MNNYLPFFMPIMIGIIVITSLAEMVISGLWVPAYYRYAIPLFRKEYPLTTVPDLAANIPELEQKLKRSMWRPSIVFRALDRNEIAFRNIFGSRNAMSGLIRLEPSQGRMRISGHLYWTFFLTPLLFIVLAVIFPMSFFILLFMLAIFVIVFSMQWYHYSQIAASIVETAVSASPKMDIDPESFWQESEPTFEKPIETVQYEHEYQPYTSGKPQSGLNNTEMMLLVALAALIVIGVVAAILFLTGT